MKKILMSVAAFCALIAAPSLAEAAVRGFATANVNMRSGPSTGYPAVTVIPVGAPVTINGCMSSVNWCDVSFAGGRGWVSGNYVQASYQSRRVYVAPDYYPRLGIPLITFDVDTYWGRYYRDRDFYRERDRWRRFTFEPGRNPPPPRPPRWEPPRFDRDPPRWERDRSDVRPVPPSWDRDRGRQEWDRDRDREEWRNRDRAREEWNRDRDRERDRARLERERDRDREQAQQERERNRERAERQRDRADEQERVRSQDSTDSRCERGGVACMLRQ